MWQRLINAIKGKVDQTISKIEDEHADMLLEGVGLAELEAQLTKLRQALTDSMASEKQQEQQIIKQKEQARTWQERAAVAVQNNNDDIARQALERRQEHERNAQQMEEQLQTQKQVTVTLKERIADTERNLRELRAKKDTLVAQHKAAKAVENASSKLGAASPSSAAFDKLEAKIRQREASNQLYDEEGKDRKLEEQFKGMEGVDPVEDELAALKRQMNKSEDADLG